MACFALAFILDLFQESEGNSHKNVLPFALLRCWFQFSQACVLALNSSSEAPATRGMYFKDTGQGVLQRLIGNISKNV